MGQQAMKNLMSFPALVGPLKSICRCFIANGAPRRPVTATPVAAPMPLGLVCIS